MADIENEPLKYPKILELGEIESGINLYLNQYKTKQKDLNGTKLDHNQEKPLLLGTCHAFNPKSEVVKRLWPKWHEN